MEDLAAILILPVISGIILLVIEYWVIQPISKKQQNTPIRNNLGYVAHDEYVYQFTPLDAFYTLAIGIVGASSGFVAAVAIRALADDYYGPYKTGLLNGIAGLVAFSDFVFGIIAIFSIVGGVALAFTVDNNLTIRSSFLSRVVLAMLSGLLGGVGILILLILGAMVLFFIAASKEQGKMERKRESSD